MIFIMPILIIALVIAAFRLGYIILFELNRLCKFLSCGSIEMMACIKEFVGEKFRKQKKQISTLENMPVYEYCPYTTVPKVEFVPLYSTKFTWNKHY